MVVIMKKPLNLVDKHFDRLTVIESAGHDKNGCRLWRCQCKCENEKIVKTSQLTCGYTRSCGCLKHELDVAKLKTAGKRTYTNAQKAYINGSHSRIKNPNPNKNSKTGVRGVFLDTRSKRYIACLNFKGKNVFRKAFDNLPDAIDARKAAEAKYFEPLIRKIESDGNYEPNKNS